MKFEGWMESKSGKVGSKSTERLKDLPIDSPEMPFSSPKRKLLEAKEKDAHFEREVREKFLEVWCKRNLRFY